MKTIKLIELVGKEVRSRSSIECVKQEMANEEQSFIIDMNGIVFVSRSFADELYNLTLNCKDVLFVNKADSVAKMLDVVWKGRQTKRIRNIENVEIENYTEVNDFLNFLQKI